MENNRKQTVIIDLRQTSTVATPSFIQYDTNILEFVIKDNGLDAELNNIERITANYKRPDGVETSRILVPAGNVVAYEFGTEEMAEPGYGEINVQFFQGETRLSSKRLKVYFASNLGAVFENSAGLPLLQELFVEVSENNELLNETNNIIQGNETVRITAENDRITAEQERQTNTLEAISNAENATIEANDAAVAANTAKLTQRVIMPMQLLIMQTKQGLTRKLELPSLKAWMLCYSMRDKMSLMFKFQVSLNRLIKMILYMESIGIKAQILT